MNPWSPTKPRPRLMRLEPRMMFDGAGAVTADAIADTAFVKQTDAAPAVHETSAPVETAPHAPMGDAPALPKPAVVFIDAAVPDRNALLANLEQGAEVIVLDANRDGVEQISAHLKGRSDLGAIHIISHGREGELQLGNAVLDANSMANQYSDDLSAIRDALSAEGDLLIYGCDFAEGAEGQQAMQLLANLTDADVAASSDITGHADFGGDWVLETQTGSIETAAAIGATAQDGWRHVLAPPVANNDSYSVAEDTALTFDPRLNDSDPDRDTLSIVRINGTAVTANGPGMPVTGGIVNVAADGKLVYTPDANFNGDVSFTYTVSDGHNGLATATVNLTVVASVDPIANIVPGTQTMLEDTPLVFSTATGNAVRVDDPDNSTLTVTLTATNGNLTLSRVTGLTFTVGDGTADAAMAFSGTAANINAALEGMRFASTTADSQTAGSFTIASSKPPIAAAAVVNGGFEQPRISTTTFQLKNETDVPGWDTTASDNLIEIWNSGFNSVPAFEGRQFAELNATQNSKLFQTITPPAGSPLGISFAHRGRSGIDVMNAKVTDLGADGLQNTADDRVLLNEDFSDGRTAWGFYERNLGTASGNRIILEFSAVSTAAGGDNSVGNFLDGMMFGDVSYSDRDTVNISVAAVRDAENDSISTNEDTAATFNVITGTGGATADSFENSGRVISSVTQPTNGTVTFNANGTVTYTPKANFHGTDTFTYTVTSGGTTETATVTMTVLSVNDVPTVSSALPDQTERDGNAVTYSAGAAFADRDGDALTFTATGLPPGLSINAATGEITGTLGTSASARGPYDITVTATDPRGAAVSDTFRLTVTNDTPEAVDDSFETAEDTQLRGNVLLNDSDGDGDAMTVSLVSGPTNGTVVLNADGSFVFTPALDFHGVARFTYRVRDADGATRDATVTIDVAGTNDPPIADVPLPDHTAADSTAVSIPVGAKFSDPDGDRLTFTAEGLPPGLSIDPNTGTITGTLDKSASAGSPYVITVTGTDPGGASASASFTLTATNPEPTAVADSFTTNEDNAVSGNVRTNDSDVDGDALQATLVSGVSNGTLVFNADGTFTYTPAANFNGTDSFTYRITDADGASTEATVTLTVNPVNDAPRAVSNSFTTPEDTEVTIPVLANDSDVEGDPLTVTQVNGAAITLNGPAVAVTNGSVTLTASGLVFKPGQHFNGHIAFNYTVGDGKGGTATAAVTGIVTPVNDAPVASDDTNRTFEEIPLIVPASTGLLAGDTDVDDLTLKIDSFSIGGIGTFSAGATATIPGVGQIVVNADGSYSFTPARNYNGAVPDISYVVSDAAGLTDTGVLKITVDPLNDAPTVSAALPDRTARDSGVISYQVSSAFFDQENDTLTFTASGLPPGLSIDPVTGAITGTLGSSASKGGTGNNGVYDITVTATDPSGALVSDTFRLTVTNDAPVAVNDSFDAKEDTVFSGNVLLNDTDADGDSMAVTHLTGPTRGVLVLNADGSFTYTPELDFNGVDSFTYRVTDADGATHDATVTIDVSPDNDVPVAKVPLPDQTFRDGATVNLNPGAEFSDADGDTLTFTATGLPPGLSIDSTGKITGTLGKSASVNSPYVITVTATDGTISTSASFTLTATNDTPVAGNDSFTTNEDNAVTGSVLTNDSDADGDSMTVSLISGVANGTLALNADGTFSYTPHANFTGTDSFTYRLTDADGASTTATVTITVDAVNDPPVAVTDSFTTNEDQTVTIDVLGNDHDAEGDPLTVTHVNGAAITLGGPGVAVTNGTVALTASGLVFTPSANFHGPASFTYTVSDGKGGTTTATVSGTVIAVNDPPVVSTPLADQTGRDGRTVAISAGPAFSDRDGDTLRFTATGLPPGLSINAATGQITGTLGTSASANGPYDITVTATDPSGTAVSDTFRLTVTNDAPVALNDRFETPEDTQLSGNVLLNDSDGDGDALTAAVVSGPANGTLVLNPNGTFTYTPNLNFNGLDQFTYKVTDADGATHEATVTLDVGSVNDTPFADLPLADQTAADSTVVSIPVGTKFHDPDGDTLKFTATGLPPGLDIDSDTGEISGTLDKSASVGSPYVITVTAADEDGLSVSASFTFTATNPAPTAVADSFTTNEDTAVTSGNVLTNDSDTDGDGLTASLVSGVSNGTLVLNTDGTFTYTPNANFNGTDSFTYRVTDADGASTTATVTLTVNPVNDPPVAVADSFTTNEDNAVTIDVLANDRDVEGNPLTITEIDGKPITPGGPGVAVTGGTVTLGNDGRLVFTPTTDSNGPTSFSYTVSDGNGGTTTATVTGTVNAGNDPPDLVAQLADHAGRDGGTVTYATGPAFSDRDGDALTFTATNLPPGLSIDPRTGAITGTLDSSASKGGVNNDGIYDIVVTATDPSGEAVSDTFRFTVTNIAPVAVNDTFDTKEDEPLSRNVLSNDTDADGDSLTVSLVSNVSNGTLVLRPDGSFTYTPNTNFNGVDSFTYQVTDADGATATATVTIDVNSDNDAPVANVPLADHTFGDGDAVNLELGGEFSDPDGDRLTFSATGLPNGLTIDPATGKISGTLDKNASVGSPYVVIVTASDGSVSTSASFTLTATNDIPVAGNDSFAVNEDTELSGSVLTNDSDPDGDDLTVSLISGVANGTLVLNADGTFTYTPHTNFNGTDSFTYRLTDADGASTTATVTITVDAVNDPPVAVTDSFTTNEDETVTIDVLGNDHDAEGDTLTVTEIDGKPITLDGPGVAVTGGTVTLTASGLVFTPTPDGNGPTSFSYTVSDGKGGTTTATVTGTVNAVNDQPDVSTPIADQNGRDGGTVAIATRSTFSDRDGDTLTFTATGLPPGLSIDADTGEITGTLDSSASANGPYDITVIATDPSGASISDTFRLTVTNDAPIAVADNVTTNEDVAVSGNVLTNDSDPDGDSLTVSLVSGPANGTLVLNANGSFTFTPNTDFNGTDSFIYRVTDADGATHEATVTIDVGSQNDAPVADGDSFTTNEDGPVTIDVTANDRDTDGNPLTVTEIDGKPITSGGPGIAVTGGVVTLTPGGLVFTPNPDYDGPASFTYTVSDGQGGTATATVTGTVNPVNDVPVTVADSFTTNEDGAVTIDVTANDRDADGNPLTITEIDGKPITSGGPGIAVTGGVVTLTPGGLVFTPNPDYDGPAAFTYTVSDGQGGTATATVTGTVTPVNDPPVAATDSFTTNEDGAVTIDVTANDRDADGNPLMVTEIDGKPITSGGPGIAVTGGVVTLTPGGLVFTPNPDYEGPASFTYTVSDGQGGTATATVTGTVKPVNDAPVTATDSFTTNEDGAVTIDVTANDRDADGNPLTITEIDGQPITAGGPAIAVAGGTVTLTNDGRIVFTPNPDYEGPASFTYTVSDGQGGTRTATVTGTVEERPVTEPVIPPWYSEDVSETAAMAAIADSRPPLRMPRIVHERDELERSELRIIPFVLQFAHNRYGIGFDVPRALQRYAPTGAVETMKEGQRAFTPRLIKPDVTDHEEQVEPYLPENDDLTDAPHDTKPHPAQSKGWVPERAIPLNDGGTVPSDGGTENGKSETQPPAKSLNEKLRRAGSTFTQGEQRLYQALTTLEQNATDSVGVSQEGAPWERHAFAWASEEQTKSPTKFTRFWR